MEKTLEQVARRLAYHHRQEDPETTEIYLSRAEKEVRLVEVSESVGSSGEVLPFRFTAQPSQGIPYPSVVILLSPEEWSMLQRGELELPDGWTSVEDLEELG